MNEYPVVSYGRDNLSNKFTAHDSIAAPTAAETGERSPCQKGGATM